MVGTVRGQILEEQWRSRFWGWKVVVALLIVSMVLIVLKNLDLIAAVLAQLATLLVIVVGVVLVVSAIRGGRGVTGTLARACGAAARGVMGVTRMGVGAASGSIGLLNRNRTPDMLTMRRFRIVDLAGNSTSCVMLGEVYGDIMRQGDLVRVHGEVRRDGNLRVRRVDILEQTDLLPRSVVQPRWPPAHQAARIIDVLCKLVAVGVLAFWITTFVLQYGHR